MSSVRSVRPPVAAILVADLHLSLLPPAARAEEPDWLAAMDRPLSMLRNLAERTGAPVLCAGDIFDRWNSPPELLNWAIERLPHLHAVAGNHDLPNHRPELGHRSAYGTLVRAGKITDLCGWPVYIGDLAIYGRYIGEDVPLVRKGTARLHVLVTHEYIWTAEAGYPGAPREARASAKAREFRGFDVVVTGDNHQPFYRALRSGTRIWNCGTLLRRKTSEKDLQPRIGLLSPSGAILSLPLATAGDVLSDTPEALPGAPEGPPLEGIESFVESLSQLESDPLDFRDNLRREMDRQGTRQGVRDCVLEALGDGTR